MDLDVVGEELKGIPTDALHKLEAWISKRAREVKANTGDDMNAKEISRLLMIERTQRAMKDSVIGDTAHMPVGFLDAPTPLTES